MSALGGSMVPRFVMPDFMNTTALFTINGWALDGFLKVLWYDDPSATLAQSLFTLAPQVAVLALMAAGFLASPGFWHGGGKRSEQFDAGFVGAGKKPTATGS